MGSGGSGQPPPPEAERNLKKQSQQILRSGFDYFTFRCFQIFRPLPIPLMQFGTPSYHKGDL